MHFHSKPKHLHGLGDVCVAAVALPGGCCSLMGHAWYGHLVVTYGEDITTSGAVLQVPHPRHSRYMPAKWIFFHLIHPMRRS